jgi:hypothetical protein
MWENFCDYLLVIMGNKTGDRDPQPLTGGCEAGTRGAVIAASGAATLQHSPSSCLRSPLATAAESRRDSPQEGGAGRQTS